MLSSRPEIGGARCYGPCIARNGNFWLEGRKFKGGHEPFATKNASSAVKGSRLRAAAERLGDSSKEGPPPPDFEVLRTC